MKKLLIIPLLAACLFVAGCGDTPQEAQAKFEHPDFVANVNGRALYRVSLYDDYGNRNMIYFFKDSTNDVVSTAFKVGKVHRNVAFIQ